MPVNGWMTTIMPIVKDEYFELVNIKKLISISQEKKIQILGKIIEFSKENRRIVVDDGSSTITTFIPENDKKMINNLENMLNKDIVRIFGLWDGITLNANIVIPWNIKSNLISELL